MINTSNRIGWSSSAEGPNKIEAVDPIKQNVLPGQFAVATSEETDLAVEKAYQAWRIYRNVSGAKKAAFLRSIAEEIENLGDELVQRVMQESGLPEGRVKGERGRTCNQLRLFASVVEEGSWVEAIVDPAIPEREPIPRADIRKMLRSLGPVVVFTASNFPLAFSTAGGDTASALAAGCPVIVKAHPSHLGTNALIAEAILKAVQKNDLPDGLFSSLQDSSYAVGTQLVKHPKVKAVAFTGSLRGGMAIYKMAQERNEPIPVFAEMGSINPVFIHSNTINGNEIAVAQQIAGSVNLGAGQFCTNPGLLIVKENDALPTFIQSLQSAFDAQVPANMLNEGIYKNYVDKKAKSLAHKGVKLEFNKQDEGKEWKGLPTLASTTATTFLENPNLHEEVFGPYSLLVKCKDDAEMIAVANHLEGQLSASILGSADDLEDWQLLIQALEEKVGRLLFNGMPTGVEVGYAMQHGGPFPASTDSRFTSVGTDAIKRFARPVCFQNCPDALLPDALKADNPLGILRTVNGELVRS